MRSGPDTEWNSVELKLFPVIRETWLPSLPPTQREFKFEVQL